MGINDKDDLMFKFRVLLEEDTCTKCKHTVMQIQLVRASDNVI
uniref:Uncharacterized protein n=1 Tax=Arundo donax TaxID=35708 RepID=A0A0A9F537_ARUDO